MNSSAHELPNFRHFFAQNLYEKVQINLDPFAEENDSLLWVFSILYFEDFAIFQQRVYNARKISEIDFDYIFVFKNGRAVLFNQDFWKLHSQAYQSVTKDKMNFQETEITFKTKTLIWKTWVKKTGVSILDLSLRRILNFIFCKVKNKVKNKVKREFRYGVLKALYLISKISLQVASKSDYTLIVDAGHLKVDPVGRNRSFFMDYYPDLEETYKKLGKVTVLNL